MKTRPIIFSGEMVRAILDGRKTMTRRVMRPQPSDEVDVMQYGEIYDGPTTIYDPFGTWEVRCPYGRPGDRLWVRETWQHYFFGKSGISAPGVRYQADHSMLWKPKANQISDDHWRPSIFMPRWASRIDLEVTGVRVERLQEISEIDCEAEGVEPGRILGLGRVGMKSYREGFVELWDAINAKRGYSWDTNPWVWVVEFKRADPLP